MALGSLVAQYRPALKEYLRSRFNVDQATAEDLVQGFLLDKVLKRDLIARAEQSRGKFRTFLLTAINRYVLDTLRRENAASRIPKAKLCALHEVVDWHDLGNTRPPGADDFDNAFVRQVLALAVHNLHARCQKNGHRSAWKVFYHRVLTPTLESTPPTPYEELAAELGLESPAEARNLLVTAKRILQRELRTLVEQYTEDSAEASDELRALRRMLR
jgi:DNA-directed RNA polymerase specialized sigma24 family protein